MLSEITPPRSPRPPKTSPQDLRSKDPAPKNTRGPPGSGPRTHWTAWPLSCAERPPKDPTTPGKKKEKKKKPRNPAGKKKKKKKNPFWGGKKGGKPLPVRQAGNL